MKITLLPIISGLLLFLIVIVLVRKNLLKNTNAYLWIIISMAIIVLSILLPSRLIANVSLKLGIHNPPQLLSLFGFFLVFLLMIAQSIRLTSHEEKLTRLTQELAILKSGTPLE